MPRDPYIGDAWKLLGPDEPAYPGVAAHLLRYNDWFECPYSPPEVRAGRKRERHARWIASITARDWERLAERGAAVMAGEHFARFDDLDAPIAIYVGHPGDTHPPNGERFGTLSGTILMAFQKRPGGRLGP